MTTIEIVHQSPVMEAAKEIVEDRFRANIGRSIARLVAYSRESMFDQEVAVKREHLIRSLSHTANSKHALTRLVGYLDSTRDYIDLETHLNPILIDLRVKR